jgi:1-acyl-sn-glycerol-3-phosphate acyltransferase
MLLIATPLRRIHVRGEPLDHRLIRMWQSGLMRVFGFRVERRGVPLPGATLFVANHVSWIDITALHSQRMMGFVAKREISRWPVVGYLATRGETIYHERGNSESMGGVLHEMLARLRAGRSVGVFPEGRTRDGHEIGPVPCAHFPGRGRSRRARCNRSRCVTGAGRVPNRWSPSGRGKALPPTSCACWASRPAWRKSGSWIRSYASDAGRAAAASPNRRGDRIVAAMEAP